jgi:hypothetical protein
MPLILPGNVGSATAATTYSIANSCRFNDDDGAHLTKTLGTPTNVDRWTVSYWIKRGKIGGDQCVFAAGTSSSNEEKAATFKGSSTEDQFYWQQYISSSETGVLLTNQLFRDPAAWYHFVLTYDSGNGTAGNRMRMYVNGTEVTSFATDTNPTQNLDSLINSSVAHYIGCDQATNGDFDGYMAEFILCDGQAYAASDFGEFSEDSPTIWMPKDPSGLTFGDNGFWLDFEDSSALGNDVSGNNNDWTANNLAAIDQCSDSPTNNFCTLNPLDNYHFQSTYSQGNCKIVTGGSGRETFTTGTMGVSSGKWYYEVKCVTASSQDQMGFTDTPSNAYNDVMQNTTNGRKGFVYRGSAGAFRVDGGTQITANYDTWTDGDVLGVYIDLDNLEAYVSKNGTLQNSGTGQTITAASSTKGFYLPAIGDEESDSFTAEVNFGNPVSALSSAVADANGYGQFEYSPSGTFDGASKDFLAICSKNLAEYGG